jgi:hypothetical protein
MVRPARIELATLGLGVPCSIQFELRARTFLPGLRKGFFRYVSDPAVGVLPRLCPMAKPLPPFLSSRPTSLGGASRCATSSVGLVRQALTDGSAGAAEGVGFGPFLYAPTGIVIVIFLASAPPN